MGKKWQTGLEPSWFTLRGWVPCQKNLSFGGLLLESKKGEYVRKAQKRSQPHFLLLDMPKHHKGSSLTSLNLASGREKGISRRKENICMCSSDSNPPPAPHLQGWLGSPVIWLWAGPCNLQLDSYGNMPDPQWEPILGSPLNLKCTLVLLESRQTFSTQWEILTGYLVRFENAMKMLIALWEHLRSGV